MEETIGGGNFLHFGRNVMTQGHVIHMGGFFSVLFSPFSFLEKQLFDIILIE